MSTDAVTIPRPRSAKTIARVESSPVLRAAHSSAAAPRTDEDLAALAQAGSMPAFVALVSRFETRLYNFLLRRVSVSADAEDLAQETFLRAWRQIHRYQSRHRFSTWLFTIASRLALDHHRSSKPCLSLRSHHLSECESATAVAPEGADTHVAYPNVWTIAANVLSEEQHSAMWLRYAENLSNKEIGRVLGRSSLGVRVMLHRARRLLASHLGDWGRKGEDQ